MAKEEQDTEQQDAQSQHKRSSMLKHHADTLVVALSETSCDEDLYAHGKTHRQSGEDEVIQARHHGATQLVGAEVTQKGCVGEGDDGLRQITQHDGVRNAPDFAIRYGGFYHAAKIMILMRFPYGGMEFSVLFKGGGRWLLRVVNS